MVWIAIWPCSLAGNQREHARFHFVQRPAGQKLRALLGPDHMLQNQARAVLRGQFRGKRCHHSAGLVQAGGAENGARGKVAITAVH